MNKLDDYTFMSVGACGCCETGVEQQMGGYDCSRRATVFTQREEQVLHRIRELSGRARELQWRIKHLSTVQPEQELQRTRAVHEFEGLRAIRAELEAERVAAAKERMRLLGYI